MTNMTNQWFDCVKKAAFCFHDMTDRRLTGGAYDTRVVGTIISFQITIDEKRHPQGA